MEITPPQEWTAFAAASPAGAPAAPVRWLAHPGGESLAGLARLMAGVASPPGAFALAVGPEGGFTPDEVAAGVAAGWQAVDLGPAILRVETAAAFLVAAACLTGERPGLGPG
jgi:16S rRNA (uracil1498-N3)-methyltransferase